MRCDGRRDVQIRRPSALASLRASEPSGEEAEQSEGKKKKKKKKKKKEGRKEEGMCVVRQH